MNKFIEIIIIVSSILCSVKVEGSCWFVVENDLYNGVLFEQRSVDQYSDFPSDLNTEGTKEDYEVDYLTLKCIGQLTQEAVLTPSEDVMETYLKETQSEHITTDIETAPLPDMYCAGVEDVHRVHIGSIMGEEVLLDIKNIIRSGNIVRACQVVEKKDGSVESLVEMNCGDMSVHSLQEVTYSNSRDLITYNMLPTQKEYVDGYTNVALYRLICSG